MINNQVTYLALLRGINVGGKSIIKMVDLNACFEEMGLEDVRTYIQSGNVIFKTANSETSNLIKKIEAGLLKTFKIPIKVVIVTQKELKDIIKNAPKGFGEKPDKFRYDVIFLKEPLTTADAMKSILLKEGVDEAHAGKKVIYHSRLIAKATQSKLSRVVMLPVYQNMTIRNWNTTTKLLKLMSELDK